MMNPDVDMIEASQNSNTPTVQNQPDQNDASYSSQMSNSPTAPNEPIPNYASYSSQMSNTPTAPNEPIPNYGGAEANKLNIFNLVGQFNPTEGNKNSGNLNVENSYEAAILGGNPTPASCSNQNSNTPTAQNQPVTNNGRVSAGKYNLYGQVGQSNPTEGNENTGEMAIVNRYIAAKPIGNPTRDIPNGTVQTPGGNLIRDIPNGTSQPLGGNLIRDIPIDERTIQPGRPQSVPVNEASEGKQKKAPSGTGQRG